MKKIFVLQPDVNKLKMAIDQLPFEVVCFYTVILEKTYNEIYVKQKLDIVTSEILKNAEKAVQDIPNFFRESLKMLNEVDLVKIEY
ncbi:hypothetical protein GKC32_08710 [Lactobacillus curvatus]|nr:hypothetical protein [Latilactobacillus curvatus]MSE24552.1 hypothetical protein [Latilactobacillus curvatus]